MCEYMYIYIMLLNGLEHIFGRSVVFTDISFL